MAFINRKGTSPPVCSHLFGTVDCFYNRWVYYWKNLEENSDFNKKHIMFSVGLTIAPIFLIVLHQLSVGNIGPKSDNMLCSDFCSQNGYSASGMPPKNSGERSCICFDDSGNEIMRVPIDSIVPSE